MDHKTAWNEASRCLLCDDPPCHHGCPCGIDPREFIRKIRFHDLAGAARHLRRHNVLAGCCAELCPVECLCEGRCLSEKLDRPIDIAGLQRYVCAWERESGELSVTAGAGDREQVAVVGAGPAGLSCAAQLARRGFAVTLFDAADEPGGLLRSAVPEFRLPAEVLAHDVGLVAQLGVSSRLGEEVGEIAKLRAAGFAAIFVATGTGRSVDLQLAGAECARVHAAIPFLQRSKEGRLPGLGRRVAVIGGGDTAVDAARVARRMGCDVTILYRRSQVDMPAHAQQVRSAWQEGVEFQFQVVPLSIACTAHHHGDDHAASESAACATCAVSGVHLQRVRWEAGGRRARRHETLGEPFLYPCDDLIVAVGLQPVATHGLPLGHGMRVRFNPTTLRTPVPGIFVGGDLASGPGMAVAAVGMGALAAEQIDAYLSAPDGAWEADDAAQANGAHDDPAQNGGVVPGRGGGKPGVEPSAASTPLPGSPQFARATAPRDIYPPPEINLEVEFCGLRFENPFLLAAAPPTDDLEMVRDAFRAGWAGAILKTTSVSGTKVALAYPMISAAEFEGRRIAGLGNIDLISEHHVDAICARVQTLKEEFPDKVVGASIMGERREDWQALVHRLEAAGVDMIECSFSCPQGSLGERSGFMLGQDPSLVRTVTGWIREAAAHVPVVIKITPQVTDIVAVARAAQEGGAHAICASNTIPALMGFDLTSAVPEPTVGGRSTYAGLSGPAIRPITLRTIAEIASHVEIPITGTGGPTSWRDAVEFMLAGASTVQFCTAVMRFGTGIIADLCEGLAHHLMRQELDTPAALVGRGLPQIVSHERLPRGLRVRARIDPERCIRDDVCSIACRDGGHRAITVDAERLPSVDRERCVGCGLCLLVCPVAGCISLQAEGTHDS